MTIGEWFATPVVILREVNDLLLSIFLALKSEFEGYALY